MTDAPDDLGLHPSKRRCPIPDCGLWSHCDHTVADVFDRITELEAELSRLKMVGDVKPRCRQTFPQVRHWECERPIRHKGPHIAAIDHVEWEATDD